MRRAPARAWLALLTLAFVPIPPAALARAAASRAATAAAIPAPAPAPAAGQGWRFDAARSSAEFVVRMRLRMRAQGRIEAIDGELRGDPLHGWSVSVDADGRSLKVAGPRWMERSTRSDEFLAVDSHPDIRFRSERFSDRVLRGGGRVRGELTLRGLTRPVSLRLLPSACAQPGRDCDLRVNGIISRTAFGMTAHSFSVKDDVELRLRVRLMGGMPGRGGGQDAREPRP
jgi:polyisoprenoid-binding protein YceI